MTFEELLTVRNHASAVDEAALRAFLEVYPKSPLKRLEETPNLKSSG